jgi:hypothetical protein
MAYEQIIPWAHAAWFDEVNRWVHTQLAALGTSVSGAIEQFHAYPWSTVLRVPTATGNIYFKAVSPIDPHEPAVVRTLARQRASWVPSLLAIDDERGWMLMRDAGHMLRADIRPTRDIRPWLPVLPLYAQLQIEMVEHVPELLVLGVPDRRLSILPDLYEPLLADVDVLCIDQPNGLTLDQYHRLLALSSRVRALCEQLAAYPVPETLNHGDLTDGNILVHDGLPVFIDWGDSCISHPFYSLRTVLVSAEISLQIDENDPQLYLLRDAYLEPWTRYAPRDDLLNILDITRRLAPINGALTWHRLVSKLEGQARADYALPVPALLQEFLDAETGTD